MNKKQFIWILEVALLHFDNVSKQKIISQQDILEELVNAGIDLCNYLKGIKIKQ